MKQQTLERLVFFGLGALVVFIGYGFGTFQSKSVNAQTASPVIEEIVCRRLRVVDELGKTVAILGKKSSDSGRVRILEIFNSSLNSVFLVGHNPNKDGVVYIVGDGFLSGAEHRGVYLGVDDKGGVVQVSRNDGPTAQMSIAEYGGAVAVFNNAGKNVGHFGVTDRGHGALQTKDKFGNIEAEVP